MNPFTQTEVDVLKEAFPTIQISVIEETLRTTRGDVNEAIEKLLNLTDPSPAPPLPNRPNRPNNNSFPNPSLNPFTTNAKPLLTVRQELAQWRQELRTESRQRAECIRNSASSTPNLSISNMFRSTTHNSHHNNRRCTNNFRVPSIPSVPFVPSVPNFQRPMISVPNNSSPHISYSSNYTTHHRSNSNPVVPIPPPTRHQPSSVPPALPVRRQSSNSMNSNYNARTNPFHGSYQDPSRQSNPTTQQTESFNPFEEPELPPPAYSEIQKDTLINLSP